MYDCAIIGTGPAGLSAAVNLKLHEKNIIWFGSKSMSKKVMISEKIANYPGLPMISGAELNACFIRHVADMGLEVTDRMVSQVMYSKRSRFSLLAENELFQAKTLILATGVSASRTIPGEAALLGQGVSYCATCDGFLYKGKTIAVVCADSRFEHEILYLAELAQKVYLFPYYQNCTVKRDNIELRNQRIVSVNGTGRLSSLTVGEGEELAVDGLFCMRTSIAPTTLFPALASEDGAVTVDRRMATNIPGCFACGDCTGAPYQIAKAVGEGNTAAHSVIGFLAD
ncbi:MAG: FAD-dependent oxidoreductase [Lachnospiraceae bacterium]|nr:FAD-dependent oxidoreductase [Lachnospiraceae bacterium]